jgi:metal-sulfur cluster biosynthetic enzyme
MTEAEVRDALRVVVDPELGVNIVDLGLVYDVSVDDARIRVTMAMTSPMCPLGDYLKDAAVAAIRTRVPDAGEVAVEIVDDPPWHPDLMSPQAKKQLGGAES